MTRRGAIVGPLPGARPRAPWRAMARNLAILWVGQVFTKLIAFVALAALARRLSPESYGAAEFALGLSAFAWLVIEGGFGAAGVRRLKQNAESTTALAALVPAGQMLLSLLVVPAMLLYAWFAVAEREVFILTCWMAASVLVVPWKQDWLFQAAGRFDHVVAAQVIRVVLFAAIILGLIWTDASYWLIGVAEFIAVLGSTLYLIFFQRRLIAPLGLMVSWTALRSLVREGAPIGAGAVCWAATQFVPLFAIGTMAGMTDTAYFGAAHRLGVSLITFSWLYHFNLFPSLAGQRSVEAGFDTAMVRASVRLTAWGGIALALGLALAADSLLPLLFGPPFIEAAVPFSIIVWTFPLTLVSGHARWLLVASNRSGEMLLSQVAGVIAALATSIALILPMGTTGAAIGMTAAALAVWIASQVLAARKGTPVPWRPCILPMLTAAAIIVAAGWWQADPWLEAAAGVAVLAAIALLLDRPLRETLAAVARGHLPGAQSQQGGKD